MNSFIHYFDFIVNPLYGLHVCMSICVRFLHNSDNLVKDSKLYYVIGISFKFVGCNHVSKMKPYT